MAQCKVIKNEPVTMSSPAGGFDSGRKITFELPSGTIGVVKVTDRQVSDGSWQQAIDDECAKLSAIDRLGQ